MRQISTLFACLILLISTIYAQDPGSLKTPGLKILNRSIPLIASGSENVIRIRCMATPFEPLFIIDGVVAGEFELKNIDPNDIESIAILKDQIATALYGCRGSSGVVLITTKNASQRTIQVKDMLTNEPLAGANIVIKTIGEAKRTIHLVADSVGKVLCDEIDYGKDYEITVSYSGYKGFRTVVDSKAIGKKFTVLLVSVYKDLEDVTVKAYDRKLKLRKSPDFYNNVLYGAFRCVTAGITFKSDSIQEAQKPGSWAIKFYPNPVLRAQKINIEFENINFSNKATLKLLGMDGKMLCSKEYALVNGMNKLDLRLSSSLSSGMYIIQIIDENNRAQKTDQLIIQ